MKDIRTNTQYGIRAFNEEGVMLDITPKKIHWLPIAIIVVFFSVIFFTAPLTLKLLFLLVLVTLFGICA